MKIRGKKVEYGPASETIVFPRGDSFLAFRATAVLDKAEFEKYCPLPKMPKMRVKGGALVDNPDDERYKKAIERQNKLFLDWLLINSLTVVGDKEGDPDTDIEWEQVIKTDKTTWELWETEFKEAGMSKIEGQRLFNLVMGVNSLNDQRLDEARASFLLHQQRGQDEPSSLEEEPTNTPSGEPANESESDHQESLPAGTTSIPS